MRRLLPPVGDLRADAGTVDLSDCYWVPESGSQLVVGVMISSVDGSAQLEGRSGDLGNEADADLFAVLRAHADVILVGAGTTRAEGYGGDRPTPAQLAVRRRRGLADAPRIAVVTRGASLDPAGPLFTDTATRPLVITCRAAPADRIAALAENADIVMSGQDDVDLAVALDELAARGLRRVSCEGGPSLLAQVAAAGRLDELALTLAPMLVAGSGSRITHGPALDPLADLTLAHVLEQDGYLYLRYRRDRTRSQDAA